MQGYELENREAWFIHLKVSLKVSFRHLSPYLCLVSVLPHIIGSLYAFLADKAARYKLALPYHKN